MNESTLSGEEILRRYIQPAIKAARDAALTAQAAAPGEPTSAITLVSILLLGRFTDRLIARMRDLEVSERVAVYHVIAHVSATALGQPESQVFPAVLSLCAGAEDEELVRDVGSPEPLVLESLRRTLAQVMASYLVQVGRGADRTVEVIVQEASTPSFRKTRSTTRLAWQALPEDVRERALRYGQDTVSFTLYPRGGTA